MTDLLRVDIDNGKYTVILRETGDLDLLRFREEWIKDGRKVSASPLHHNDHAPVPTKMILAMAQEIQALREALGGTLTDDGFVSDGAVALCPRCRRVREGTLVWHIVHKRECGYEPQAAASRQPES